MVTNRTVAQKATRRKMSMLELAEDLGNVSEACKIMCEPPRLFRRHNYVRGLCYGKENRLFQRGSARSCQVVSESVGEYGSQWMAITSIAAKIGCTSETLRRLVRQQEKDYGRRERIITDE